MQTKEKKISWFWSEFSWFQLIWPELSWFQLRAGHAAAQPKNKTIFSQVQFVCCLYTMTSFFSTSLNMSDSLLMPCDRKKQQQQKYYDEFSFSLNLEKNVAKIQTNSSLNSALYKLTLRHRNICFSNISKTVRSVLNLDRSLPLNADPS